MSTQGPRLDLFLFAAPGGPAFELWAPRGMRQVPAPESLGALIDETAAGFAPNIVIGHDRIRPGFTMGALVDRLVSDAAALPGAEVAAPQTVSGASGEVRLIAFTHAGAPPAGPLSQVTACLLAPGGRDLIYLTGTCACEQAAEWQPIFIEVARSVRFDAPADDAPPPRP